MTPRSSGLKATRSRWFLDQSPSLWHVTARLEVQAGIDGRSMGGEGGGRGSTTNLEELFTIMRNRLLPSPQHRRQREGRGECHASLLSLDHWLGKGTVTVMRVARRWRRGRSSLTSQEVSSRSPRGISFSLSSLFSRLLGPHLQDSRDA
jgi:hypothetical protein